MRVALVNPSFQTRMQHVAQTTVGPPLGLAYVAGGLREAGHHPVIIDANALGLSAGRAADAALAGDPLIVGITATTPTIGLAAAIGDAVKARRPGVRVVVGGPHASALPAQTLREFGAFDLIARGEGDRSFAALVTALEAGGSDGTGEEAARRMRGFAWRNPDGTVHDTGLPDQVTDLETLPEPARDLLPMDRYRGVDSDRFSTLLAMRGCPCSCTYCAVPEFFGRRMRYRAPASVATEMQQVHRRWGVDFISFVDDTFTTRRAWVLALCDELTLRGLHRQVKWVCLTRADMVDVALLRRMKQAGCVRVEMSIETGSETGRRYLRKGLTERSILRGYDAAREAGLSTMGFLILNIPGETAEDVQKSLDLAIRADPDFLQVSFLTPYPGTPLRADAEAEGWIGPEPWSDYSFLNNAVLHHGTLPSAETRRLRDTVLSRFWLRPRTVVKLLRLVLGRTTRPGPLLRTIRHGLGAVLGGGARR